MPYLVYTKGKLYLSAPRALVVSEEVLAGTDQDPGVGREGGGGGGGGGGLVLVNWLLVHATLPCLYPPRGRLFLAFGGPSEE